MNQDILISNSEERALGILFYVQRQTDYRLYLSSQLYPKASCNIYKHDGELAKLILDENIWHVQKTAKACYQGGYFQSSMQPEV